jgi:hypothetical protein
MSNTRQGLPGKTYLRMSKPRYYRTPAILDKDVGDVERTVHHTVARLRKIGPLVHVI